MKILKDKNGPTSAAITTNLPQFDFKEGDIVQLETDRVAVIGNVVLCGESFEHYEKGMSHDAVATSLVRGLVDINCFNVPAPFSH